MKHGQAEAPGFEAMAAMMTLTQDWAAFYAKRARRDYTALCDLQACASPAEAVEIWNRAAASAMRDYAEQIGQAIGETPNRI